MQTGVSKHGLIRLEREARQLGTPFHPLLVAAEWGPTDQSCLCYNKGIGGTAVDDTRDMCAQSSACEGLQCKASRTPNT
jgi:hypothetical protein